MEIITEEPLKILSQLLIPIILIIVTGLIPIIQPNGLTQKQAVHIHTLISQKEIEAPGVKKKWWQFW